MLLYFYSNTCTGCKITSPIVDKLISEGKNIKKINAFEEPEVANLYVVRSLPNFIVLDGKKVVNQMAKVLREDEIRELL
jgi:thioredoxin-like negative regulator of GroEL